MPARANSVQFAPAQGEGGGGGRGRAWCSCPLPPPPPSPWCKGQPAQGAGLPLCTRGRGEGEGGGKLLLLLAQNYALLHLSCGGFSAAHAGLHKVGPGLVAWYCNTIHKSTTPVLHQYLQCYSNSTQPVLKPYFNHTPGPLQHHPNTTPPSCQQYSNSDQPVHTCLPDLILHHYHLPSGIATLNFFFGTDFWCAC